MNDQQFHREQTERFALAAQQFETWAAEPGNEPLLSLSESLRDLARRPDDLLDEGPPLVHRLFTSAPAFAAAFPRDLLWYLGAECLHFMPDDEIEQWSALDEDRRTAAARGLDFDWRSAARSASILQ